jgi:hypothetical protein
MLGLLFYGSANIMLGPASHSPLLLVPGHSNGYLNWSLVAGSTCCLSAIFIPDNLWRLYTELSGHLFLITTTLLFVVIAWQGIYGAHSDNNPGLSLNLIMFVCISVAAIGRTYEISKTIRRTWFKRDTTGALVEIDGTSADTER